MIRALSIRSNSGASAASRALVNVTQDVHGSVGRLSSGLRVQSSSDDSAALAVAENMRAHKAGVGMAIRNATAAVAMLQTAESGLATIGDLKVRMRELAVQSASDGISDDERALLNTEYVTLREEIERVAGATEYNGQGLLGADGGHAGGIVDADGDPASRFVFQIGFQNSGDDQLTVDIKTGVIDQVETSSIESVANAQAAIDSIDLALNASNGHLSERANIGAHLKRLYTAIAGLQAQAQNFETAVGQKRDADLGDESMEFNKSQVLQNAGVAMLSQANAQQNVALRLLG